jgi:hypothetical protein
MATFSFTRGRIDMCVYELRMRAACARVKVSLALTQEHMEDLRRRSWALSNRIGGGKLGQRGVAQSHLLLTHSSARIDGQPIGAVSSISSLDGRGYRPDRKRPMISAMAASISASSSSALGGASVGSGSLVGCRGSMTL